MTKDYNIELVGKIVVLIETLRDEQGGLSLQELANRTGYVKSSIHRILHSLKKHGYIEQESPGGSYRLGMQFLTLARGLNGGISLLQMARPYLRELVETFNESAYLAVLHADRGIFVDVQESNRDLRLVGPLGAEVHYHATAAGKVMAAFMPSDHRGALLDGRKLERLTEKTLTKRAQVENELAEVKRLGYGVNDEETIVGAIFLAAPIFDAQQSVCGSISVGIPKPRFSEQLGKKIASQLKDACQRLSSALATAEYVHENRHRAQGAAVRKLPG
ncbi:MAG: IclR family transcriptional regulator [Acidobacteriota bacterium]|nr:IclR family transcriptional regulator [Acidobacteriota bacterium]